MINRFGFYGHNITTKLEKTIKKYKKIFTKSEYSFYVKQSTDTFYAFFYIFLLQNYDEYTKNFYVSSD
ncbi:hypothetical protein [Fusobacterium nucleatum]|uniref:Uncharacterized protein n=1 Tax=Fusobacterium nucleatum TaxID=851 RepID=A0A133NN47_FUSNU|nr:hypothetical protein [Fusobacterium nucleatum]KXA17704.1 hypothetical protein HMPREF3221_01921 [Fusobacterium nucleatum]MCL4576827.1 hypothetical protein [Fusobacterium nucleatum YWH7056]MCL4583212.1 hypothetical protein [Fusobacterium nucleatum YWH7054]MCL4592067.1 hypothetical protein [Fusobacterium nucleatum YWH7053]